MVTKLIPQTSIILLSLILAKNHMVTKRTLMKRALRICLILAKNHMVTKQRYLQQNSHETFEDTTNETIKSYSSKKSYGNKTFITVSFQ